jgi:alpha-amylase
MSFGFPPGTDQFGLANALAVGTGNWHGELARGIGTGNWHGELARALGCLILWVLQLAMLLNLGWFSKIRIPGLASTKLLSTLDMQQMTKFFHQLQIKLIGLLWIVTAFLGFPMTHVWANPAIPTDLLPTASQTQQTNPPLSLLYFVLVDRFANGDLTNDREIDLDDPIGFHGGDIQGVINHLDYLQELGVTHVLISPVWKMQTEKTERYGGAFHGYWVIDPQKVEPRFGNEADLVALADALHKRHMGLILDMVYNHMAYNTELLQTHPDWFHHYGPPEDILDPFQRENYDVFELPDLAQENPEVYAWLRDNSFTWIDNVHPQGFRLDAAQHLPASFLKPLNHELRTHGGEDFIVLGEDSRGNAMDVSEKFTSGDFSHMFDFPLYYAMADTFCHDWRTSRLAEGLSLDPLYSHPEKLVTFLDNHDFDRIYSQCQGDSQRLMQALAFLFTVRGIPAISYGTEIPLAGPVPLHRGDMKFPNSPTL